MEETAESELKARLALLSSDEQLVSMLADRRLQAVLRRIDSSGSRFEELENELESNRHFNDFVLKLMQVLGYYDAQGRFLDPASNN